MVAVNRTTGQQIKFGGYLRDRLDPNDQQYQPDRYGAAELPPVVDLREFMTDVENQGELSSCTANAMAGAYEYLAKRILGESGDVSRLFVYYNARAVDGDQDKDEGTYLRNCIQVLREMGTCPEDVWPYDVEMVNEEPSEDAYQEAAKFLIEEAERVEVDLYAMKHCLAEGFPFAFGLTLFESFMKRGNKTIPMPNPDREKALGGHAMLCVGYSDPHKVFVVRNSWGDKWADKGYCYIPYDYMTNPELCHDCWTIRNVSDLDFSSGVWFDYDANFYSAFTINPDEEAEGEFEFDFDSDFYNFSLNQDEDEDEEYDDEDEDEEYDDEDEDEEYDDEDEDEEYDDEDEDED
ncbi:C1 family peptidase [[Phormidium] sp. ETS-05]|uniref:C1 family peptidase n=1 Tax=[Phormidium] sp. ETS-05 TaxID=222819 RepID=UPI0018EF0DE2|nr:C1 family peptidase [[Phormidium] sp. ETS-05]